MRTVTVAEYRAMRSRVTKSGQNCQHLSTAKLGWELVRWRQRGRHEYMQAGVAGRVRARRQMLVVFLDGLGAAPMVATRPATAGARRKPTMSVHLSPVGQHQRMMCAHGPILGG